MARKRRKTKRRRGSRQPREDPWIEIAASLGGHYVAARGRQPTSIWFRRGAWEVRLAIVIVQSGSTPVVLTRCSAHAYAHRDLGFRIYPKGKLAGLAAALGLGGLPLRNPRLDEALVARSSQPHRLRAVLADPAVAEPLLSGHRLRLRLRRPGWWERRRLGPQARTVVVETDGRVAAQDRLAEMVTLVAATLERLAALGAIHASRAPVTRSTLPT